MIDSQFEWDLISLIVSVQIVDLESDKRDYERQVNELKARADQVEKKAADQKQVEEKKHAEEIQFLKKTNQQLKVSHSLILSEGLFIKYVTLFSWPILTPPTVTLSQTTSFSSVM